MRALRRRRLIRALSARDERRRWNAARELSQVDDAKTLRRLQRLLDGRGRPEGRAAAAYVLGFSGTNEVADVLARRLADREESVVVRAHAAEALGHLLQFQPVLAEIRTPIVSGLQDPEPEVRFWAAFAAGVLDLQESRLRLERLRPDPAVVEGWWTVGQEAEWALRCLDGEEDPPLPERVPPAADPETGGAAA
jgi:HEAT repeat protein